MNHHISISDFNYELPEDRIAKVPVEPRDHSKLLVYRGKEIQHSRFYQLPEVLNGRTALVFNNTKVIYARLQFVKPTGGRIEVFCLAPAEPASIEGALSAKGKCTWQCMIGNAKKWKDEILCINHPKGDLFANKISTAEGEFLVQFTWNGSFGSFAEVLLHLGNIPLPPYLKRESEDNDKFAYQTVYAQIEGSVAAPTAGLHFTPDLLNNLITHGNRCVEVTLHVGAGTFLPVKTDNALDHVMHSEKFAVSYTALEELLFKEDIVAVGTTSLRTLESIYWLGHEVLTESLDPNKIKLPQFIEEKHKYQALNRNEAIENVLKYMDKNSLKTISGSTQLMITPTYNTHMIDALITNFHQPKSTLLLLIASIVGQDWHRIYNTALANDYRFLSFGDSSILFKY